MLCKGDAVRRFLHWLHGHTWTVERVKMIHRKLPFDHWDAEVKLVCFYCPATSRHTVFNCTVEEGKP